MDLYTNSNPQNTIKGLGFKDKEKALASIEKIKNLDKIRQKQIVLTMYYRAKHHPNRTINMEDAMKIFKKANVLMNLGLDLY